MPKWMDEKLPLRLGDHAHIKNDGNYSFQTNKNYIQCAKHSKRFNSEKKFHTFVLKEGIRQNADVA
jgi:hypothetical protein